MPNRRSFHTNNEYGYSGVQDHKIQPLGSFFLYQAIFHFASCSCSCSCSCSSALESSVRSSDRDAEKYISPVPVLWRFGHSATEQEICQFDFQGCGFQRSVNVGPAIFWLGQLQANVARADPTIYI